MVASPTLTSRSHVFGLAALRGDQLDAAYLFGHEHAAVGQERDTPGQVEAHHLRHGEGEVRVRLLLAASTGAAMMRALATPVA